MNFLEKLTSLLNKIYRKDDFIRVWLSPIATQLNLLFDKVTSIKNNFFFDTLDVEGCRHFEKLLAITTDESMSLEDRRSRIQAKWLSNSHNSISLIQTICNSWKNGEILADFLNGKITLKFVGSFGVPDDLESLKKAVNEIKPAHLPYEIIYKYLLIKDIHEVKTIEQMENLTLDQFAQGIEEI